MNLNNSFILDEMMKTAQTQMIETRKRVGAVDNMANQSLGGRSRASLLGAVVVSLIWAVAFLFAYHYFGHYIPEVRELPLGLILLGLSLVLVAFVVISYFVQLRYYGTILSARDRLARLDSRLAMGQSSLSNNLQVFRERRRAQWELPLEAGSPIEQEANLISSQLSGMEALSRGFISKAKVFLYYMTCVAWAAAGAYALFDFAASLDLFDFSDEVVYIIMVVALVITCIVEVFVAKAIWSRTNEDVGNITLLAIPLGPVVFVALVALAALAIVLLQVVLYLAALVIGIACVIGSFCGG